MALSTVLIQPVSQPAFQKSENASLPASLLSMLVLSVYAVQKGNRNLRRLKRRFLWTAMKLKLKSLFAKKAAPSDRTLLYILLGVLLLILIIVEPILALIIAVTLLILYLAGVLKV